MRRHDRCEFCGGPVRWKKATVELRRRTKWMIFENVPLWICLRCGERYCPGPLLQRLERVLLDGRINGRPIRARVLVPKVDCARLAM